MSKVYSFRLSDDNPREAQAREVIEVWAEDGYSLRHLVVDAMLIYSRNKFNNEDLNTIAEYLEKILIRIEQNKYNTMVEQKTPTLSSAFVTSVKDSVKTGLRPE
jgi:hypothetical protein